jgi:hypothetical protein
MLNIYTIVSEINQSNLFVAVEVTSSVRSRFEVWVSGGTGIFTMEGRKQVNALDGDV